MGGREGRTGGETKTQSEGGREILTAEENCFFFHLARERERVAEGNAGRERERDEGTGGERESVGGRDRRGERQGHRVREGEKF